MNTIDDDDLILYHWRDGIDAVRIAEIDAALADSAALRKRYAALQALLEQFDAVPATQPDAGFEQRLWRNLAPRITVLAQRGFAHRLGNWFALKSRVAPLRWAGGAAFAMLCIVVLSFHAGRQSASMPEVAADKPANSMAPRVLDSYVAAHLRATEGLLMTAVNGGDAPLGDDRELAAALVDSNRLYVLAATRAGNGRLAEFLRQLEPVLIELANPPRSDAIQSVEGLRDYVRRTDLLFEVRATEARIDPLGKRGL